MPPTLSELLDVARQHDMIIHTRHVKINKAIQEAGVIIAVPAPPVHELVLHDEEGDPFNGNVNNRRVASRIATEPHQQRSANHSEQFLVGNPTKARNDVAKSLAVNPDPLIPNGDELPPIKLPTPTPGSPAEKKAAKASQKTQAAPAAPVWGAAQGPNNAS